MSKYFFASAFVFLLFSCSHKDEQFCDCLKAGEELNEYSSKLFDEVITPEIQKKMQELKAKKTTACKNYQKMGGPEMLELKENCGK